MYSKYFTQTVVPSSLLLEFCDKADVFFVLKHNLEGLPTSNLAIIIFVYHDGDWWCQTQANSAMITPTPCKKARRVNTLACRYSHPLKLCTNQIHESTAYLLYMHILRILWLLLSKRKIQATRWSALTAAFDPFSLQ